MCEFIQLLAFKCALNSRSIQKIVYYKFCCNAANKILNLGDALSICFIDYN